MEGRSKGELGKGEICSRCRSKLAAIGTSFVHSRQKWSIVCDGSGLLLRGRALSKCMLLVSATIVVILNCVEITTGRIHREASTLRKSEGRQPASYVNCDMSMCVGFLAAALCKKHISSKATMLNRRKTKLPDDQWLEGKIHQPEAVMLPYWP
jgi:hypothetical protein